MDTQEFLSAVYEVIRLNYPSGNPEGMTAARAGFLIRQAFPGLEWESIGFPKLKHILEELQSRELVRIGKNYKHALTIWLDSAVVAKPVPAMAQTKPSRQSLRKDVWNAFVLELPLGRRFINRRTGDVRMAALNAPRDLEDWVEIHPISQETQKEWACDFVRANNLQDDQLCVAALDRQDWFRHFPSAISAKGADLVACWNRVRTQNVITNVRLWCESESVLESLVFEQRAPRDISIHGSSNTTPQDIRAVILRALNRMTVDELLDIRIPSRHLLVELGMLTDSQSTKEN